MQWLNFRRLRAIKVLSEVSASGIKDTKILIRYRKVIFCKRKKSTECMKNVMFYWNDYIIIEVLAVFIYIIFLLITTGNVLHTVCIFWAHFKVRCLWDIYKNVLHLFLRYTWYFPRVKNSCHTAVILMKLRVEQVQTMCGYF